LFSLLSGYLLAGLVFDAPRSSFGIFGMPDIWATLAYGVVGLAVAATGTAVHAIRRQMVDSQEQENAGRSRLLRQLQDTERELAALKRSTPSANSEAPPALADGVAPLQSAPVRGSAVRTIRVVDDERDSADSLALLLEIRVQDGGVSEACRPHADAPTC
jgi:hypothetical protein